MNDTIKHIYSIESADKLDKLYELTHETLQSRATVATAISLLRSFMDTNQHFLNITKNETSVDTINEILHIISELEIDFRLDKSTLNDLNELNMKLHYILDFDEPYVVLDPEYISELSEILYQLDVTIEGLESVLSSTVAFEHLGSLLYASIFIQSTLLNMTSREGTAQLASTLLDLEQWYDQFQDRLIIYESKDIRQLQDWVREVKSLAAQEGTIELSNIDDLIIKIGRTVQNTHNMRSSLFIQIDNYERILYRTEQICNKTPAPEEFMLGTVSQHYHIMPNFLTLLAQLADGLKQLQVTEDPALGSDSIPLLLDIYSAVKTLTSQPQFLTLEILSEYLLEVKTNTSLVVMRESVEYVLQEIYNTNDILASNIHTYRLYGHSATRTLEIQSAVSLVKNLLHRNATHRNSTAQNTNDALEVIRSILIHWSFDHESVNSAAVLALSYLVHDEEVEVPNDYWFHWLLNMTLTSLSVQENLWQSFVNVDEAYIRYQFTFYSFAYLSDIIEVHSPKENRTSLTGGDPPSSMHWGAKENGEKRRKLQQNKINRILKVLLYYNSYWSVKEVISYSDRIALESQASELKQLLEASKGPLKGKVVDHLLKLVTNNLNITHDILLDLETAEMVLTNSSYYILSLSFLESFSELIDRTVYVINHTLSSVNLTTVNTTHANVSLSFTNATEICGSEDLYEIAYFLLWSMNMTVDDLSAGITLNISNPFAHHNITAYRDIYTFFDAVRDGVYSLDRAVRKLKYLDASYFDEIIDVLLKVQNLVHRQLDDIRLELIQLHTSKPLNGDLCMQSEHLVPLLLWCSNSTTTDLCH